MTLDARKLDPDGFEGFNLMTAGALEDRQEKRRWTHSVWENADGELRRIVHSNALFQCTDYGGMRDGGGMRVCSTSRPSPVCLFPHATNNQISPLSTT
jgi:hypothetical protein